MSPLAATRSVFGALASHTHAPHVVHRVGERPATLQRKDFSAVPVCGSVRPIASQRALAGSVDPTTRG